MAVDANSAPTAAWNTLFAQYQNLNQRLIEAPAHKRDALEREIADVEDNLLDSPAPNLIAVMHKLGMMWSADMLGIDQASEEKRLILEDLEGLIQAQRELLGA